jgi:hypothetical protein
MPRQKENLSRMHQPQKVLVVELTSLPYPMRRGSTLSTVLTATPDHKWQVTYSPFRNPILQLTTGLVQSAKLILPWRELDVTNVEIT